MIRKFQDKTPRIPGECFVAETASVIGDVTLGEGASVWYGAVVRADAEPITVGAGTNIQDCAVLHCDRGFPLVLGRDVTVGHSAIVHGATVRDRVMIGMHATVMNGSVIGEDSIIGAGALVTEGTVVPPGSLVLGVPGKVVRPVTEEQRQLIRWDAQHYRELAQEHKKEE